LDFWLERDPIKQFKERLVNENVLNEEEIRNIEERVRNEIDAAAEAAANAPWPDERDFTAETYAGSYHTESA